MRTPLPTVTVTIPVLPPELAPDFTSYSEVAFDSCCSEPTGWGFKPLRHLGDTKWGLASEYGDWHCLGQGCWRLVVKWLTPTEAILKYGPVTGLVVGCQGGFRLVAFGSYSFLSSRLDPRKGDVPVDEKLITVLKRGDGIPQRFLNQRPLSLELAQL